MICGAALAASAQNTTNGTWTSDSSDYWTTPGRWANNTIASGLDATGNFATINITADRVVTLTNEITIGHLLFGDGGTASHLWWLTNNIVDFGGGNFSSGAFLLSVSAGVPTIWVTNQTLHLAARLDGTQGFRKYGGGTFVLWNTNSTMTGSVQVEGGFHQVFGEGAYGPTPGTFTPNAVVYSNLTVQNINSFLVFFDQSRHHSAPGRNRRVVPGRLGQGANEPLGDHGGGTARDHVRRRPCASDEPVERLHRRHMGRGEEIRGIALPPWPGSGLGTTR